MRCNLRRTFTFVFFVFATTLVILSLPKGNFEYDQAQAPLSKEVRFNKDIEDRPSFEIGEGVGAQNPLPNQPLPPSLDKTNFENPFEFLSAPDRSTLRQLNEFTRNIDLEYLTKSECKTNTTLAKYWGEREGKYTPQDDAWERFYAGIGSCGVYDDDVMIDTLLKNLNNQPIKSVHIMDGGTQVKFVFTFENDKQAVFKPMRFGRDYESDPNHFYFSDFERHHAEIATFHLDRILGFRRAVPTVGRIMNITSELFDKAEKKLKKTFFYSPANNFCFVSRCDYYCDTTHAICGKPDLKEGSVQVFLPDENAVPRKHNRSPYRRTYSKKNQLAEWQTDMNYCTDKVKTKNPYAHGRRLLDLVDLHILDYLIGNQDRHHFESFSVFSDIQAYAIHLDHGRAFGRTDFDDDDILMPLRQCCVIRPSTLKTLMAFYSKPKSLSKELYRSMSKDPVHPILSNKHYPAIERRLRKIIKYIIECLEKNPVDSVVMAEYHNADVPRSANDEKSQEPEEGQKKT